MCGIAGFFGKKFIPKDRIVKTLSRMKERGPDSQNYFSKSYTNKSFVCLLHSRLSIIDLHPRSNQPFIIGDDVIIYNGEIYNYLELKKDLISKGIKLKTNSDTEILLHYYKIYGQECVNYFEGMWSFAIFNTKTQELFLSRDRFGEKPMFFYENEDGIFFGSEIKFLQSLCEKKFNINLKRLNKYLSLGYKSLFKDRSTFFVEVKTLLGAENLKYDNKSKISVKKYWNPKVEINQKLSLNEAIEKTRDLLIQTTRLRMRSDVPTAFCLSGGIDSAGLVSIASKKLNVKIKSFSIIDSDSRYNESENIKKVVSDINCDHDFVELSKNNFIENLKDLVLYHDGPVATASQYCHSLLMKEISKSGYKVAISGTAADELFTGYYDHYLLHLYSTKNHKNYNTHLSNWKKFVLKNIRNPLLKKYNLYNENPGYRDHIYDNIETINNYLLNPSSNTFTEANYSDDLFSNRRMNELFHEITPLILSNEDLNAMKYSIENRSPYLDKQLFEFAFSIPQELLIQQGYGKYILRESYKDILIDDVRNDRQKRGFNASINSLLNFNDNKTKDFLLDKSSSIFELIDFKAIEKIFNEEHKDNYLSKFIFYFISAKLFLDNNND